MIDPLQLQALVDGECSPSQRRELLEHCDSNPEHWREIALAMLEEQQFSKQLHHSGNDREHDHPPHALAWTDTHNPNDQTIAANRGSSIVRTKPTNTLQHSWRPVLAAGLIGFAAFWSGRMLPSPNSQEPSSNDRLAANQSALFKPNIHSNTRGAEARVGANGFNATNQLVSDPRNPYEGLPETDLRVRIGNQDIPIFDPNDIDPQLMLALQAYEIQKANQRLRQQGFEIDLQPEYMTGQLNDGRQVVVPIHQVGLRPYGQ